MGEDRADSDERELPDAFERTNASDDGDLTPELAGTGGSGEVRLNTGEA